MNAELTKKLFDKYPKIFKDKDASMRTTCMCWGIETGDGWFWLLDNLCASLQGTTDNCNPPHPQVIAVQVKEKFGALRYYVQGATDIQYGRIELAERMSHSICEDCGSTSAKLRTRNGWQSTRCDKCWEAKNG